MSPGGAYGGYYDDHEARGNGLAMCLERICFYEQGSGGEDEEEFAFHWLPAQFPTGPVMQQAQAGSGRSIVRAGVDAADPRDLAKRDWANQDSSYQTLYS